MITIFENRGRIYKIESGYEGVRIYTATENGLQLFQLGLVEQIVWQIEKIF